MSTVRGVRALVALIFVATAAYGAAATPALAAADSWEPAQVLPRSGDGNVATVFTTERGRAVTIYKVPGAVYASSRPEGPRSTWSRPHDLPIPRYFPVGPIATGRGGGATVFLGETYARMDASGRWGPLREFPYHRSMSPATALVAPDSAVVVAGTADGWHVKVAVKPPGGGWQRSPGLSVSHYTVLRGLWADGAGRIHVLVTRDPHPDDRVRVPQRATHGDLPLGLYEAVLRRRDGALTWGPLREWSTGSVGELYENGPRMATKVLSTADGAITAIWHEYDESAFQEVMFIRHRDAGGTWSPARTMTVDGGSQVVSSLDEAGVTRLFYLRQVPGTDDTELVTRDLSPDGAFSEPVRVDGPEPIYAFGLYGATAPGGGTSLLRWNVDIDDGDEPAEQRYYRCTSSGCTRVMGEDPAGPGAHMVVTASGAGLIVTEDGMEGCSASRLCSTRLPLP